jgi:hypothetical protein
MRLLKSIMLVASLAVLASLASAHTPYMKPSAFSAQHDVSAETAYSTDIFTPVVGIAADGLSLIGPSGERLDLSRIEVEPDVTRIDAVLARDGTYRLTTGEQYGEVTRMVLDRGRWRAVSPDERLPRRARTSTLQTVTLAEAYVTRGAPDRGAVDIVNGRLAIRPVTHPNEVFVTTGFEVELLFDEAPFAFMPFVIYRPGEDEDDMKRVFVTDEHGRAHLRFDAPGLYLAVVRFRCPATRESRAAVHSYSTSITFEVLAEPETSTIQE